MINKSRFIVGIDLGTTNIAVSYIDIEKSPAKAEIFKIPQLIAPGEVSEKELFPAAYYCPDSATVKEGAFTLPWGGANPFALGIYARDAGSLVSASFVSSVKSWLCHSGVDRQEKILPWGSPEDKKIISPVDATRLYLEHIRNAWNFKFGNEHDKDGHPCLLENQQLTITVPASFDDTARELTLEAASAAGLKKICLLEEPLAAFYDWLNRNNGKWEKIFKPGDKVLIADIGGGTTDFSIIKMEDNGTFTRTAAGEHLLLGGDNIDMALARQIESSWKTHLSVGDWTGLCHRAREAKEILMSENAPEQTDIVLLSRGSSLIGNMRKASVSKIELLKIIDDGFFPEVSADSPPIPKRMGIKTMGLPYVNEPAVTRHLLEFLRYAALASGTEENGNNILRPDKILFNGGTVIPESIRNRIIKILKSWFPGFDAFEELESNDLSLAVASGAAWYGAARRGLGAKVRSGTLHSYFIEVEKGTDARGYICVMPRGTDENTKLGTDCKFFLETNKKVVFPLYYSSARNGDYPGEILHNADELLPLSRLVTVLRHSGTEKVRMETQLAAVLTETGVLQVSLEAVNNTCRWPLSFDVRAWADLSSGSTQTCTELMDSGKIKNICDTAFRIFTEDPASLPSIFKKLEAVSEMPRRDWPLYLLREMADVLLQIPPDALKSAEHEARWLNLCGFCLRPGLGDPADEIRLNKVWKIWHSSNFKNFNQTQVSAEWWIFWRRIASGLRAGYQKRIGLDIFQQLCPKGEYAVRIKKGQQVKAEMWKCLGAFELLSAEQKKTAGDILAARAGKLEPYEYWVLARIGGRRLFSAPVSHILPPEIAEEWLAKLITVPPRDPENMQAMLFAFSRICAVCGDRAFDIHPETLQKIKDFMIRNNAPSQWVHHLETPDSDSNEETARIFGDSLPLGLKVI